MSRTSYDEKEFEALFADPTHYPGNRAQREAFRHWAGKRFDSWYKRGLALAKARRDAEHNEDSRSLDPVEFFESDWWPSGPKAYVDMINAERRRDALAKAIEQAFEAGRKTGYQEGFEAGRLAGQNSAPA